MSEGLSGTNFVRGGSAQSFRKSRFSKLKKSRYSQEDNPVNSRKEFNIIKEENSQDEGSSREEK